MVPSKIIYLVRHGTTAWIEEGKLHGSLDSPLSAFGEWEAQQTARALASAHITHIFSSPQGRAMQTAEIIAHELDGVIITPLAGLREMDFGKMEGKRDLYKQYSSYPIFFFFFAPFWYGLLETTGEKRTNLSQRAMESWQYILSQEEPANVALVSHAITLNAILGSLPCTNGLKKKKHYELGSCSISQVVVDEKGRAFLASVNDRKHLDGRGKYDD